MKLKNEMFKVVQILHKVVCEEAKKPNSVKDLSISQGKFEYYYIRYFMTWVVLWHENQTLAFKINLYHIF